MPPKKVKRGGPRENAGRKVDSTGEYSKARTPEERRRADRENKAKSRGQEKIPEARIIGAGEQNPAAWNFKARQGKS